MTIEEIKAELPPVRIKFAGKIYRGSVSGRLNRFATVSPIPTIALGFQYSWEAVQRAVNNNSVLLTEVE